MGRYILALDQGTTSSRAVIVDRSGRSIGSSQREFRQIFPAPGYVEHDPEEIWSTQLAVAREALKVARITAADLAGIGIANQRETTILWERDSGKPVANAIVWQSRASTPICDRLRADGLEATFRSKTGLVLDAYFSGTKIRHLFDSLPGLRTRAERGEILFGTVDTFLIWRLTGGACHVTDASNASRTLLFNIHTLDWDDELLRLVGIPRAMLPAVKTSSEIYDHTMVDLLGTAVPVAGAAGDQQAATFGQACFEPGSAKNTYGTGCFLLFNTGAQPKLSENRLLTTVGWKIGNQTTYCLEGSVFIGGAVVQWLRDGMRAIQSSAEIESLAGSVPNSGGVVVVPAFVGLGAPHWDPHARGAIFGLTRDSRVEHLARAAVESMALQTRDLLEAMQRDAKAPLTQLKVDGGASVNNALMQFQADLLDIPVRRPVTAETTALGAAYLAGLAVGYWNDQREISDLWALDREFRPTMTEEERHRHCRRWQRAIERTLHWETDE